MGNMGYSWDRLSGDNKQRSTNPLAGVRIMSYSSLAEAEKAWRPATQDLAFYVFQSYDWLSLWYSTTSDNESVLPHIVHVHDENGRTLFLLPFCVVRRFGFRVLLFMGGRFTDYNAPLVSPEFIERYGSERFADVWNAIRKQLPRVDLVWLRRMPETIGGMPNPLALQTSASCADNAYAASALPSTFAEFKATRSKKYFGDTNRRRRRLEEIGMVRFEVVESHEEIQDTVRMALKQKERKIRETGSRGLSRSDIAFIEALASASFTSGRTHVSRLRVGDDVVATHIGAVFKDRFYCLMPAHESGKWARFAVGRILHEELIKWCISHKITTFDMTVGEHAYKHFWANSALALYESRYAVTARGMAALLLVNVSEWARQNSRVKELVMSLNKRALPARRWTDSTNPVPTPNHT